jgi:NAD(P)-dependent dehydrogenase (short-subunit alcohol dehydrogenase family)
VNAAGVAPEIKNPQPIWAMSDANWITTMGVNATGLMNCCRSATAQMMRQDPLPSGDRGWVVNLSSIYGQTAAPGNGTSCRVGQTSCVVSVNADPL